MQLKSRIIALPLAAVLASGAFLSPAPAQAAPKSKTYKTGAIILGAAGAYLLSKGKTVEGAAALGGGYLAYRKGEKERKEEKYNDRYGRYDDGRNNGGYYGGGNNNGGYYGGTSNNGGYYGNGSYNGNGGYYGNNSGAYYNSNADYRYNGNRNNDRDCRDNNNRKDSNRNDDRRGGNRSWHR